MKSFARHTVLFFLIHIGVSSTALLSVKQNSPIEIFTGGYTFHSSYKLHIPASVVAPSSDLIVDVYATRSTCCRGRVIYPGLYQVGLQFTVDGVSGMLEAYPKNGHYEIKKTKMSRSSIWYPALKKVLNRVVHYDAALQSKEMCYPHTNQPKRSFPYHTRALPGGKLHTSYFLRKNSSSIPQAITVDFVTELEITKAHTDKPCLTTVATVYAKKGSLTKGSPIQATIKFVETEKGLQEVSRKHIQRSSKWYSSIKKIAKKNSR